MKLINELKRWGRRCKDIIIDMISYLGIFWLFIEIGTYYYLEENFNKYLRTTLGFILSLLAVFLFAALKNKPKRKFKYRLRGKDTFIEIRVGNMLENSGSFVIPINNALDSSLEGNVKKSKSVQCALINKFYNGNERYLQNDINKQVNQKRKFKIGDVIELEKEGQKIYLLVNSHKLRNNHVESSIDDTFLSLSLLWQYLSNETSRDSIVNIPLIGTNNGRIHNLNREKANKEIIFSFIEASKRINVCEKLVINILPSDVDKWEIDLDEIEDYLRMSCLYYREIEFDNKREGKGIGPSSISNINT